MRRHLIALIAFMALLVPSHLSSSTSAPAAASASASDDLRAVQDLLDRRVAAIRSGDAAAFATTIDPSAADSFRQRQVQWFAGLRSLPLGSFSLAVRTTDSGDLAAGLGLVAQHHADAAALPETRMVYRLADYDDRDASDAFWITYVRRAGSWYAAADDDARSLGLDGTPELWDDGALSVQRTAHFLVLSKLAQASRAASLAGLAERAMDEFRRRWSVPWSERVPLIVPSSAEETQRLLRTRTDPAGFVAFLTYNPVREGTTWTITAPRLYAQDANLAHQTEAEQVSTLVHELVHAAAAPLTGPFTPIWLQEGLAELVADGRTTAIPPPQGAPVVLPDGSAFSTGDVGNAYGAALSAVSFLAERFGPQAPVRTFQAIGAVRVVAGSAAYNADAAFRSVAGMSFAEFTAAWATRFSRSAG